MVEQSSSSNHTDETLISARRTEVSLSKDIKELKEGLVCATEKLDAVFDQLDRTLNDSKVIDEGRDRSFEENMLLAHKTLPLTEMKATQTPNSWRDENREKRQVNNQIANYNIAMAMADLKIPNNFRDECKFVLRLRKEALREYYRLQLYQLREHQRNAPNDQKATYGDRFQQILKEFDARKQKMKADFKKDPTKLFKEYRYKLVEEQEAVVQLNTNLTQMHSGRSQQVVDDGRDSTLETLNDVSSVKEDHTSEKSMMSSIQSNSNITTVRDSASASSQRSSTNNEVFSNNNSNPSLAKDQQSSRQESEKYDDEEEQEQRKVLREDHQQQDDDENDSTMETLDDISTSFEQSENALRSILTSIQSNITTGRESATRRRSSASEAFLKLRMMHSIPPLAKDPQITESKSPPNTPKSPLTNERFMTKFPAAHNNVSREASFSEEIPNVGAGAITEHDDDQLLDELPNTSDIGMLLDISQSPTSSKEHFSAKVAARRLSTYKVLDKFVGQKKLIEKCGQVLWKEYLEKGDEYDGDYPDLDGDANEMDEEEADEVMSSLMLRQLCCECLLQIIQNAHSNAISRRALSSEQELVAYFKKEILQPIIEPQKSAICSDGVRTRAEKTSHFQLSTNRLLASTHLYEGLSIWPDQNLQREIDLCIIEKFASNSNN